MDDANDMLYERTWLLIGRKMAMEASAQELKELEEILKENPELHFTLQALTDLWLQPKTENRAQLESAYLSHLSRIKNLGVTLPEEEEISESLSVDSQGLKQNWYRRKPLLALFLIAMAAVIVWAANPFYSGKSTAAKASFIPRETISEISTKFGSKTNILLPDGSKVWLNAGSKLTYGKTFGEITRDVILTGEAYFNVAHNPERPFIIHTRAMDIKVLGTEFNVKSYPNERTTETSLIRGSIEVTLKDRQANKIILKPNEKLVVSDERLKEPIILKRKKPEVPIISLGHLNYFSLDSTILETSWVQNRLIFEDESFEEVAVRMARWYGVSFEFRDQPVKKLRFTGNFRNETITEALQAMQITADFKYKIADKKITLTN